LLSTLFVQILIVDTASRQRDQQSIGWRPGRRKIAAADGAHERPEGDEAEDTARKAEHWLDVT
jgi:hypothetical protein